MKTVIRLSAPALISNRKPHLQTLPYLRSTVLSVLTSLLILGGPGGIAHSQPAAKNTGPGLEEVLSNMDKRGQSLSSMSSNILQKKWTDILEEFDEGERGTFHFLLESQKVFLRKEIAEPQQSILVIRDGRLVFYQPKIKQAQRYDLGNNKDKAEFLLLGFTSNKEAMKKTYAIKWLGQDRVGDRDTYVLELTPKSKTVSAHFSRIVLWIDSQLWVPIQQKLVEPTRDYLLFQFDQIKLNDGIEKSHFDLKLPKDVRVIGS